MSWQSLKSGASAVKRKTFTQLDSNSAALSDAARGARSWQLKRRTVLLGSSSPATARGKTSPGKVGGLLGSSSCRGQGPPTSGQARRTPGEKRCFWRGGSISLPKATWFGFLSPPRKLQVARFSHRKDGVLGSSHDLVLNPGLVFPSRQHAWLVFDATPCVMNGNT